jgi:DNA-binding CsgD family transcriptional regulator
MILTPAQHAVARLYAAGLPRAEIGRRLGIKVGTVDKHMRSARAKLAVDSRRALAAALPQCIVGIGPRGKRSRLGYLIGDPLEVVGGAYAGRQARYVGHANSTQIRVQVGGATVALRVKHIRAAESAEAAE